MVDGSQQDYGSLVSTPTPEDGTPIHMKDFFISYAGADEAWAEWIGWTLEDEGYAVSLQKWDFRPGSNFVSEMQQAASKATQTIAVLSESYVDANFTEPEWAAAFAQDPKGKERKLVPVRVDRCNPPGLLNTIVYVDLFGKDETVARHLLLEGVKNGRAKPQTAPRFPGKQQHREVNTRPAFPATTSPSTAYIPKLRRQFTDLEKQHFLKDQFAAIETAFERYCKELQSAYQEIEVVFEGGDRKSFTCIVYVNGQKKTACRVFLYGLSYGLSIGYVEGIHAHQFDNKTANEIFFVEDDQHAIYLKPMGMTIHVNNLHDVDKKQMNGQEAAEYLWRVFVHSLEMQVVF